MAWRLLKCWIGVAYLFFLILAVCGFYGTLKAPELRVDWYYGVIGCLWFAAGVIFCLLQHKFRNLKWGIIIHLFLTLSLYCFLDYKDRKSGTYIDDCTFGKGGFATDIDSILWTVETTAPDTSMTALPEKDTVSKKALIDSSVK